MPAAMVSDDVAEKYFGIGKRRQRFNPSSKYGGRGGHTLLKAQPKSKISVHGLNETYLETKCLVGTTCETLGSKVDQEFGQLLMKRSGSSGGHLFQLPEVLDKKCILKSTKQGRSLVRIPEVITTTYTLELDGGKDGEVVEKVIQCSICSSSNVKRNLHRFPIGFGPHLGCDKCGKNRGCNARQTKTSVRRKRFLENTRNELKDQMFKHTNQIGLDLVTLPVEAALPWQCPIIKSMSMPTISGADSSSEADSYTAENFCLVSNVESVVDHWVLV